MIVRMFVTKTREGGDKPGETYVTLADDAPEWLRDAVYETHDGTLPCDWVYAECRDAFESDDTDEHDYADSATEVYTGNLFAWAAEHYGTGFFSQAEGEASELGEGGTLAEQLMRIQYCAIRRIAIIIWEAKATAEAYDAQTEDDEDAVRMSGDPDEEKHAT